MMKSHWRRLTAAEKQKAMERFATLVERLASVGLATETRVGKDHSLLVFVRVISEEHMYGEVYRSRCVPIKDCAFRRSL